MKAGQLQNQHLAHHYSTNQQTYGPGSQYWYAHNPAPPPPVPPPPIIYAGKFASMMDVGVCGHSCGDGSYAKGWDAQDNATWDEYESDSGDSGGGCGFFGVHCWDDAARAAASGVRRFAGGVVRCVRYFANCDEDVVRLVIPAAGLAVGVIGGVFVGATVCAYTALIGCGLGIAFGGAIVGASLFAAYEYYKNLDRQDLFNYHGCSANAFLCIRPDE